MHISTHFCSLLAISTSIFFLHFICYRSLIEAKMLLLLHKRLRKYREVLLSTKSNSNRSCVSNNVSFANGLLCSITMSVVDLSMLIIFICRFAKARNDSIKNKIICSTIGKVLTTKRNLVPQLLQQVERPRHRKERTKKRKTRGKADHQRFAPE